MKKRLFAILGLCAVIGAGLTLAMWGQSERNANYRRVFDTCKGLEFIAGELDTYALRGYSLPGPAIGDVLKDLHDRGGFPDEGVWPEDVGLDAWQRPLVHHLSQDGRSAVIYSCGPDGIDQQGAGDDIAIHIHSYVAPPTTSVTAPSTQPP